MNTKSIIILVVIALTLCAAHENENVIEIENLQSETLNNVPMQTSTPAFEEFPLMTASTPTFVDPSTISDNSLPMTVSAPYMVQPNMTIPSAPTILPQPNEKHWGLKKDDSEGRQGWRNHKGKHDGEQGSRGTEEKKPEFYNKDAFMKEFFVTSRSFKPTPYEAGNQQKKPEFNIRINKDAFMNEYSFDTGRATKPSPPNQSTHNHESNDRYNFNRNHNRLSFGFILSIILRVLGAIFLVCILVKIVCCCCCGCCKKKVWVRVNHPNSQFNTLNTTTNSINAGIRVVPNAPVTRVNTALLTAPVVKPAQIIAQNKPSPKIVNQNLLTTSNDFSLNQGYQAPLLENEVFNPYPTFEAQNNRQVQQVQPIKHQCNCPHFNNMNVKKETMIASPKPKNLQMMLFGN